MKAIGIVKGGIKFVAGVGIIVLGSMLVDKLVDTTNDYIDDQVDDYAEAFIEAKNAIKK